MIEVYIIIEEYFLYNDDYFIENKGPSSGFFTDEKLANTVCEEMNKQYWQEQFSEEELDDEEKKKLLEEVHFVVRKVKIDKRQKSYNVLSSDII